MSILDILDARLVLTGASSKRLLSITIFMVILSHLGACAFYAIAIYQIESTPPVRDTWLTFDHIVVFDNNYTSFRITKPLYYIYIRTLYWSVGTSQTVGYGDVVARSVLERGFCIVYFFVSLVLAQLAIGNLILMVNVYDSAHTRYREQVSKLDKYSNYRNLPAELKSRIKSYYEHQWKILNGLNEEELLLELPPNVKTKVRQATVRAFLTSVPLIKPFRIAILNALVDDVKTFM